MENTNQQNNNQYPDTIPAKEYLTRKGIRIVTESGNEFTVRCFFANGCDDDSSGNEAHLYFNAKTSQYECKKCGKKGNIFTLLQYFGDNVRDISINNPTNENTSALQIWQSSVAPKTDFPYLAKKKILPHLSRFRDNRLVLPLYAPDGTLSSLQYIDKYGDKKFLPGGKVAGCYLLLGQPGDMICIAEGFATAASIYEATGHATAIAFSSGNLKATAMDMKKKYPGADVIICGDSDTTGFQKAMEAAEYIGAKLAFPKFETNERIGDGNPSDFNDLFVLHGNAAVQSQIASAAPIPSKFGFTSLGDLLNEPDEEIEWIVEGLLPSSGFSLMVAKPKVGKSTLARQLALAVSRGEPFLGRQTVKGAVLYVSLEEKRGEVRKHFRLMGADGTEDLGTYTGSTPKDAHEWITKEIERKKPVLVIIDTLFRFVPISDLNDYAKASAALTPLLELARSHAAHLMALHHARKSAGDGTDATLGSTAIFGTVDTQISLKRTDARRTIDTIQRYGEDLETTVLNFDTETKMAFLGGTKEEDDILKITEAILEFLKSQDEPVTEKVIDEEAEGKTTLKRRALRDLFAKGEIARSGGGKRNDPYLYSCSLVPTIYIEQEKQDSENAKKQTNTDADARSQDSVPTDDDNEPLPLL
jgi:RecA-family ATPase